MGSRSLALFISLVCMAGSCMAQQACQASEVTIGVIGANGDSFRGLAAQDFAAIMQKKQVAVKSVTFDDGPRRVLFVVESGKRLSNDGRKIAHELLKTMLDSGRPQDSFAVVIARAAGQGAKFGENKNAL